MAFELDALSEIRTLNYGRRYHAYDTTDTLSTVLADGYFDSGWYRLAARDRLDIEASDGRIMAVVSAASSAGVTINASTDVIPAGRLGTGSVARSVEDAIAEALAQGGATAELSIDGLTGTAAINGASVALSGLVVDTHAVQIIMPTLSGVPTIKASNAIVREDGVGFLSAPPVTELIPAADAASSFTSGTATVAADQPGPDGTANTAFTVTDSSEAAAQSMQRNQGVSADSVTRTASIFVKKASSVQTVYPCIQIGYAGGTPIAGSATLDTYTGQLFPLSASSGWTVEDAGNFWKVSRVIANNGTNTTFYLSFLPTYANSSAPTTSVASLTGSWVCAWGNMRAFDMPAPTILTNVAAGGNIQKAIWSALAGKVVGGWVRLDNRHKGSGSPTLFDLSVDGAAGTVTSLRLVKSSANLILELLINSSSVATVTVGKWRTGRQCIAFLAGKGYMRAQYVRGPVVTAAAPTSFQNFNALSFGGDTTTGTGRAYVYTEKCTLRTFAVANDGAFNTIMVDATADFGSVPTAWDNFDRGDGIIGVAPSGHAYQTVTAGGGKVTAYLSGGLLVCDASGVGDVTAAYSVTDVGTSPTRVRARVSFGSSGTAGSIGLLATNTFAAGTLDYIVLTGAFHPVWSDKKVDVGIYVNNVLTYLKTITFPTPMVMDGTIYEIGWDIDIATSTATIIYPNGPPIAVQDSRIAQYAGRYITYEHYGAAQTDILPRFHYVEAT